MVDVKCCVFKVSKYIIYDIMIFLTHLEHYTFIFQDKILQKIFTHYPIILVKIQFHN